MKIQIDTDQMKNAVSLDQIVDLIFNNAAEEQAPSDFDFLKTNDRRIMEEIRILTKKQSEHWMTWLRNLQRS